MSSRVGRTTIDHATPVAFAVALLCLASSGFAAADSVPPDPAPGGAQRPYEPDVQGPANIDALTATARLTGGAGTSRSLSVEVNRTSRTATGENPSAARRFVFLFDRRIDLNLWAFAICPRATVETYGVDACPPSSRVGRGRAGFPDGSVRDVQAVNTRIKGAPGILVVIPANGTVLEQTLERVSAPYKGTYRWALDEHFPVTSIPPQDRVGTSSFQLVFDGTRKLAGRTIGFAETSARPGTPLAIGLWSEFVTGQVLLPEAMTRLTAR